MARVLDAISDELTAYGAEKNASSIDGLPGLPLG
jgi:hypothetical protein